MNVAPITRVEALEIYTKSPVFARTNRETGVPTLDSMGRQLYSGKVELFAPGEGSVTTWIETADPGFKDVPDATRVKVTGLAFRVYDTKTGGVGFSVTAEKISSLSVTAPSIPKPSPPSSAA